MSVENLVDGEKYSDLFINLIKNTFSDSELSRYFPVFIDVSYKSDIGKSDPSVRIRFENKKEDIFSNPDYLKNSTKIIEIYDLCCYDRAFSFARKFKKKFGQEFSLSRKYI
jgi:AraC-like DNA-binding protein